MTPRSSDLDFEADLDDLSSRDAEMGGRQIGVEVHRREEPLPPDSHPGHLAVGNDHDPARIEGDFLGVDAAQVRVRQASFSPSITLGCSMNPKCSSTRVMPWPTGISFTRSSGSTRGASVVVVETSSMRSCNTRLCLRWWVSASGMPELAALKIAAAPGSRIGRLSRTQSVNSSSRWRMSERCCSSIWYPVRQVTIRNATTQAIISGNQPPASSFVALAATKTSSTISRNPFTTATRIGL